MVMHARNPSTGETESGGSQVQSLGYISEFKTLKREGRKERERQEKRKEEEREGWRREMGALYPSYMGRLRL